MHVNQSKKNINPSSDCPQQTRLSLCIISSHAFSTSKYMFESEDTRDNLPQPPQAVWGGYTDINPLPYVG